MYIFGIIRFCFRAREYLRVCPCRVRERKGDFVYLQRQLVGHDDIASRAEREKRRARDVDNDNSTILSGCVYRSLVARRVTHGSSRSSKQVPVCRCAPFCSVHASNASCSLVMSSVKHRRNPIATIIFASPKAPGIRPFAW